ncbi:MAG: bifunctional precorrin-2 dehydrogenase/sirohydrochlorin ferrochelatase [Desulfobacterota bacterium]|nr:bifunctional precorrin-2 dehydrogenase/sirohydrochlorin ferrochelatase [Thermodesulfobacteriota bacterium]
MRSDTELKYFPLFLDLSRKRFLIVGGGKVAERKIRMLLRFKAKIKVVSPNLRKGLRLLGNKGLIEVIEKKYDPQDLDGVDFVISATNDNEINKKVVFDAKERGLLVSSVDDPSLCDFIMPSIVKRGSIVIAISTQGKLPHLSKRLKREIGKFLTKDYVKYLSKIGKLRAELISKVKEEEKRKLLFEKISGFTVEELANMSTKKIKELIAGLDKE